MNCDQTREKLPEYLAGILSEQEQHQIKSHLNSCASCRREAGELKEPLPPVEDISQDHMKKVLKKTRWKYYAGMVMVTAVLAAIVWVIYMIPAVLWEIWSFRQPDVSRVLMDVVQFSQPQKVNSWGNGSVDRTSLSVPLTHTTSSVIGRKMDEQTEVTGSMSVITGKVTAPVFLGASFVHPGNFQGVDLRKYENPEIQEKILLKNAETTVAAVDYSFNRTLTLSELSNLLANYDVEVSWMAVEAGIEKIVPQNMTFENQQVLQWGIPGKLSKPGSFDYAVFSKSTLHSYQKAVMDEMKWLDEHKHLMKPDRDLLRNHGIDNSIGSKADYLLKNGLKIYGLRVTGPTSELLKLSKSLDIRVMSVIGMDFWNW